MSLITIEGPSAEPISSDEVKNSGRIDGSALDLQIALLIESMRGHAEKVLGRRLMTQTVELVTAGFGGRQLTLTVPNVSEILSVQYVGENGVVVSLPDDEFALLDVGGDIEPCAMRLTGERLPVTAKRADAVRVRFKCGYGDKAADVPGPIRLWMLTHAIRMLQDPDGQYADTLRPMPFVDRLLNPHKVIRVV